MTITSQQEERDLLPLCYSCYTLAKQLSFCLLCKVRKKWIQPPITLKRMNESLVFHHHVHQANVVVTLFYHKMAGWYTQKSLRHWYFVDWLSEIPPEAGFFLQAKQNALYINYYYTILEKSLLCSSITACLYILVRHSTHIIINLVHVSHANGLITFDVSFRSYIPATWPRLHNTTRWMRKIKSK